MEWSRGPNTGKPHLLTMDFSNRFQRARSSFPAEARRNPSARKHHNNFQRVGGEGEGGQTGSQRNHHSVYQPLSANTRQTAKSYFKLIQAIHHKNIIDKAILIQTPPKGMARQITKLTAFIRPSSPTEQLREAVHLNTQTWLQNSLLILQQHYAKIVLEYQYTIWDDLAFQVAANWMAKRYKARLAADTLGVARSLLIEQLEGSDLSTSSPLVDSVEEETPEELDLENEEEFPPLSQVNRLNQTSLYPEVQIMRNSIARDSQSTPLLDDCVPPPQFNATGSILPNRVISPVLPDSNQRSIELTLGSKPTDERPSVPPSSPHEPSCPLSSVHPELILGEGEKPGGLEVRPVAPQIDEDLFQPTINREKFTNRTNRSEIQIRSDTQKNVTTTKSHSLHLPKNVYSNVAVLQNSLEIHTFSQGSQTTSKTSPSAVRALANDAGTSPGGARSMDLNSIGERSVSVRTKLVANNSNMMMGGSVNHSVTRHKGMKAPSDHKNDHLAAPPANLGSSRGSAPATTESRSERQTVTENQQVENINQCRPMYHKARKGRKVIDWAFRGTRPVWFLGDSNLNRVPAYNNDNIQIDSYPGASFYHFLQILEKTQIHPNVKLVVLSIGINNRDQDADKTSNKQLRMLYKRAQSVFPNADVFFPLINFSPLLPKEQQQNLTSINNFASKRFQILNPLPNDQFNTVGDNIHWTPETAQDILVNWCKQVQIDF